MQIKINDIYLDIIVEKKRTTKNTYIRVKEDLKVHISTNIFTTNKEIERLINNNINSIEKMYNIQVKKKDYKEKFFYLGKEYSIVYNNSNEVYLGENKVFVGEKVNLNKWYLNQAKEVYKQRLDILYNLFTESIPYPKLKIRSMKTRWGVCNGKDNSVTLNLELIKKEIKYLDYVIVHELSHFIYMNHSKNFWNIVQKNYKDYKNIRKNLSDY